MIAEFNQAKRFFGIKFGYGEPLQDGIYAVPTQTSKGRAFMRMEVAHNQVAGKDNFKLFWDESLKTSWYVKPKPFFQKESKFAKLFRQIETCR